jgi:hypothetical protein
VSLDRVDVEKLLARLGIEARRRGREWFAKCPNSAHEDRSPSWRIRDEPGATKHGYHKCFGGETEIITRDGKRTLSELAGKTVEVLTYQNGRSRWQRAPIMAFGKQALWTVRLRRNGIEKIVRATADHRWMVRSGDRWVDRTTERLVPGHRLRPAGLPRSGSARWLAHRNIRERAAWRVVSVEPSSLVEEVFCAAVEESHCFALDGFILTGNCWPCGFGGTVVGLVQHVKKIEDARDAILWIEQGAPVEQREVVGVEIRVRPPALRFRLPEEVVVEPLSKWPTPARKEVEKRGISARQVERWGIGYAVEGRLAGRVVYVLRDAAGRPKGYSARTFVGEGKRFLEPEDREGASATAMFGEQHWPALAGRRFSAVFVFEGASKALAAEAALPGIAVAATTGSEPRPLAATKLSTFGRVILVGDDDEAGNRLSEGVRLQLARVEACEARRLKLREDADDLPREELRGILEECLAGR